MRKNNVGVNCTVSFRTSTDLRDSVTRIATREGIDLSTAMRLIFQHIATTGQLPFTVPGAAKKAMSAVTDVLTQNFLPFTITSDNIVLVHQKNGDFPIGVCERNIRTQDSRQISVEEGNRFMQNLLALSAKQNGDGAIAFVWSIGDGKQNTSIIPLSCFGPKNQRPAYLATQNNGDDYRLYIRETDQVWIRQTTQQLLMKLFANK